MDEFGIYEAVWARAEADGAIVHYGICRDGEGGWFFPWNWPGKKPRPEIQLHRPYYEDIDRPTRGRNNGTLLTEAELRAELLTLSHEYGHYMSWKGRTTEGDWARYFEATKKRSAITDELRSRIEPNMPSPEFTQKLGETMQAKLGREEMDMIMREETLAWEIGRELLVELGYERLDEFDAKAKEGLHHHRVRLGLEPFAPETCGLCSGEARTMAS